MTKSVVTLPSSAVWNKNFWHAEEIRDFLCAVRSLVATTWAPVVCVSLEELSSSSTWIAFSSLAFPPPPPHINALQKCFSLFISWLLFSDCCCFLYISELSPFCCPLIIITPLCASHGLLCDDRRSADSLTNPHIEFCDTEGLMVQFLLRSCNSCHTPHSKNSVRSSHLFLLLQPTTLSENRNFIYLKFSQSQSLVKTEFICLRSIPTSSTKQNFFSELILNLHLLHLSRKKKESIFSVCSRISRFRIILAENLHICISCSLLRVGSDRYHNQRFITINLLFTVRSGGSGEWQVSQLRIGYNQCSAHSLGSKRKLEIPNTTNSWANPKKNLEPNFHWSGLPNISESFCTDHQSRRSCKNIYS